MCEKARTVIEKFGGPRKLAELLNKDRTTVYRWTYPRKKGGTGGIPRAAQSEILRLAKLMGINVTAEDLIG